MASLPLLNPYFPNNLLAWHGQTPVTSREFLSDVASLTQVLPEKGYAINLCEDRYWLLVGLAAALSRGQTTVLPQSRAPLAVEEIHQQFPACYCLTDLFNSTGPFPSFSIPQIPRQSFASPRIPMIPETLIGLIAFTSGTTGQPRPCPKTWQSLVTIAKQTAISLSLHKQTHISIVATVPPQHMYGLETSIMLPLQHGWAFHSVSPFFPEDVRTALDTVPSPRILVTTPFHLRACVADQTNLPELECIISATAPLSLALAKQAEKVFKTKVLEIYGFVEAGTLATRRPTKEETWQLLEGNCIESCGHRHLLHGPHLPQPVCFPDEITPMDPQKFILGRRHADCIKIAGHRISLTELNTHLQQIEGVEDGTFLMPEQELGNHVTRLMAFVVTQKKTPAEIVEDLRKKINPVFLPRPLYVISHLPRNGTGKLPREALLKLAEEQNHTSGSGSQGHRINS